MPYEIQHPSGSAAETIDDATYKAMQGRGLLNGFEVKKVAEVAKPKDLDAPKAAEKKEATK